MDIVHYARGLNFSVMEVHSIAGGLDLVVGYLGIDLRVEIKDGAKSPSARALTPAELRTMEGWKGRKPVVWMSCEDVRATQKTLYREATR